MREWQKKKYSSSVVFREAKRKQAHTTALERLKDASKRIRNRVLARKSMDRRLLSEMKYEKRIESVRELELGLYLTPVFVFVFVLGVRVRSRPWLTKTTEEFRKRWRIETTCIDSGQCAEGKEIGSRERIDDAGELQKVW